MQRPEDEIEHIAFLARLSLSDEEKQMFVSQLSSILDYMEKLNELDTRAVQPTSHILSLGNVMRDDLASSSLPREDALANAPAHTEKFYRARRVSMGREREKGEGKLGGLILLVVVVAVGLAAWNVVPVYYDHYDFVDKVNEICRTPAYKVLKGDDSIREMLMTEVSKRRLGTWIGPESFLVTTGENSRQIQLYYEREVEVLPGFKKVFKFDFTADQPLSSP